MELNRLKKISFCGNAKDEIISFGEGSRDAGFQLDRVQRGLDPTDWKPMKSVGQGVKEIHFTENKLAHRVIYVAPSIKDDEYSRLRAGRYFMFIKEESK